MTEAGTPKPFPSVFSPKKLRLYPIPKRDWALAGGAVTTRVSFPLDVTAGELSAALSGPAASLRHFAHALGARGLQVLPAVQVARVDLYRGLAFAAQDLP